MTKEKTPSEDETLQEETVEAHAGTAPSDAATPAPPVAAPQPPPPAEPDWETRFKYLLADFENFRRRSDRERESARMRERAELLRALLPLHEALDHARRSFHKVSKTDPMRKGMELVAHEMDAFLERNGVVPVAAVGAAFDAAEHEALVETPATPKHPDGTIVEIVQQGYRFPGVLLRPAKVVVARTPTGAPPPEGAPSESVGPEVPAPPGTAKAEGKS